MTKKEWLKKYFIIEAAVFVFMLLLDQISKIIVAQNMGVGDSFVVIPHIFNFYYIKNRGAAFGMLEGQQWFFILITSIAIAGFIFALYFFRKQSYVFRITLAVIIAGALGNLIDRIFLGYVRDFIQFAFWDSFAIFNFADSQLVVGVIILAIYIIFFFKDFSVNGKSSVENVLSGENIQGNNSDAFHSPDKKADTLNEKSDAADKKMDVPNESFNTSQKQYDVSKSKSDTLNKKFETLENKIDANQKKEVPDDGQSEKD